MFFENFIIMHIGWIISYLSMNMLNSMVWICDDSLLCCCYLGVCERIDNSRVRGENLNVVCSLVIQPAYLWLWVIRYCEVLAASLLMPAPYAPFQLADEHSLPDINMETFNDPVTRQHVTAETCSSSRLCYLPRVLSVTLLGLVRLSQYESSIRSSVPTSYGSLALYLLYSTKEKLCVKSPVLLLHIPGFSLCQCHSEVLEGDSWFVAELQWNMQCFFGGLVSEWVCERGRGGGCSTAYSTSYHMGRLQSRKGGWQVATLSPFIRTSLQMVCWECCLIRMLRGWMVARDSKHAQVHIVHTVKVKAHVLWKSDISVAVAVASLNVLTLCVCRCLPKSYVTYVLSLNNSMVLCLGG